MLGVIAKSLQNYIAESKKSDQKSSQKSDQKLLKLIEKNNTITIAQMCDRLQMSESGVKKILSKLKAQNKLQRKGSLKAGNWEIMVDI